jgi:hypothetical protein
MKSMNNVQQAGRAHQSQQDCPNENCGRELFENIGEKIACTTPNNIYHSS